jgi:hypothetical protein
MSGLPWIKVWTAIGNHPKVQRLEKELGVRDALGIVIRLWCWTADYCPGGDIPAGDGDAAARAARGDACRKTPKVMLQALVTAGLIDKTPLGFRVHDWDEMQVRHVEEEEKRREQARDRKARQRARETVTVTRDVTRDMGDESREVTRQIREDQDKTETPTVLPMPARRRAGEAGKLGPLAADLRKAVEQGVSHGLIPLATQPEADELEQLIERFGGVDEAVAFVAATVRKRDTDPQSMAWLLTVLRPSAEQGARPQ